VETFGERLNITKNYFIYFSDANISPKDVKSIGISTQRATFTTWKKSTGKPFHNLITWKDLRADTLVKEWNTSFSMKVSIHVLLFRQLKKSMTKD
jgi:glycerol kinase